MHRRAGRAWATTTPLGRTSCFPECHSSGGTRVCFRSSLTFDPRRGLLPFSPGLLATIWLVIWLLIQGGGGDVWASFHGWWLFGEFSKFEGWNRSVWRTRWNNESDGWMWRFYRRCANAFPFLLTLFAIVFNVLQRETVNARVTRIFYPMEKSGGNVMGFLSRNVKGVEEFFR